MCKIKENYEYGKEGNKIFSTNIWAGKIKER